MALSPDERREAGRRTLLELCWRNEAALQRELDELTRDIRLFRARIRAFPPLIRKLLEIMDQAADLPPKSNRRKGKA